MGGKDERQPLHGGADIVIDAIYPDRMNQADWNLLFSYIARHAGKVRVALPALLTEAGRDGAGNVLLTGGRRMTAQEWNSYRPAEDYALWLRVVCVRHGYKAPSILAPVKDSKVSEAVCYMRVARELAERKGALDAREMCLNAKRRDQDEREAFQDAQEERLLETEAELDRRLARVVERERRVGETRQPVLIRYIYLSPAR